MLAITTYFNPMQADKTCGEVSFGLQIAKIPRFPLQIKLQMYHLEIKFKPTSELTSEENTGRQKKKNSGEHM